MHFNPHLCCHPQQTAAYVNAKQLKHSGGRIFLLPTTTTTTMSTTSPHVESFYEFEFCGNPKSDLSNFIIIVACQQFKGFTPKRWKGGKYYFFAFACMFECISFVIIYSMLWTFVCMLVCLSVCLYVRLSSQWRNLNSRQDYSYIVALSDLVLFCM